MRMYSNDVCASSTNSSPIRSSPSNTLRCPLSIIYYRIVANCRRFSALSHRRCGAHSFTRHSLIALSCNANRTDRTRRPFQQTTALLHATAAKNGHSLASCSIPPPRLRKRSSTDSRGTPNPTRPSLSNSYTVLINHWVLKRCIIMNILFCLTLSPSHQRRASTQTVCPASLSCESVASWNFNQTVKPSTKVVRK